MIIAASAHDWSSQYVVPALYIIALPVAPRTARRGPARVISIAFHSRPRFDAQ
jgi:hypothetical protein